MAAMFGCSKRRIGASGLSQTQAKLSILRRIQLPPTGTTSASGPSSLFSASFDVSSGAFAARVCARNSLTWSIPRACAVSGKVKRTRRKAETPNPARSHCIARQP